MQYFCLITWNLLLVFVWPASSCRVEARLEVFEGDDWFSRDNWQLNKAKKLWLSKCACKRMSAQMWCGFVMVVWFVQLPNQTDIDYNGQSGLLRGLSVPLCPASKNFTPPEWGKGLRKSLWTPHTQLTLSLYCFPLADATDHWAQKQPDTRTVFSSRPYPTWTTHNTPWYCTSVNNSSNLHLYIGHMHIHSSVYGHFSFLYIFILLLLLFLIIVYSLHY